MTGNNNDHIKWMNEAIAQAKLAYREDEVPIGCVIVKNNHIIAKAYNRREGLQLSTAHAEILAIHQACNTLHTWRLEDCVLYVTLEPCPMCTGAIIQSRIQKVIYGALDPKGGCIESCTNLLDVKGFNHYPEYEGGYLKEECSSLLTDFFKAKRKSKKMK